MEENYKPEDTVWVGARNEDGCYEPFSCVYKYIFKGKHRLPIYDTKEECQTWCDKQPQRPPSSAGVDNLMSDFEYLYDKEKKAFIEKLRSEHPDLLD